VNKIGLPFWKLTYSISVYIILPENTHQYLFTAAVVVTKYLLVGTRYYIEEARKKILA
jgi:hypothetical protein